MEKSGFLYWFTRYASQLPLFRNSSFIEFNNTTLDLYDVKEDKIENVQHLILRAHHWNNEK